MVLFCVRYVWLDVPLVYYVSQPQFERFEFRRSAFECDARMNIGYRVYIREWRRARSIVDTGNERRVERRNIVQSF